MPERALAVVREPVHLVTVTNSEGRQWRRLFFDARKAERYRRTKTRQHCTTATHVVYLAKEPFEAVPEPAPVTITARTVTISPKGVRSVTVECPYCGRKHVHGWPVGEPQPGPRISHCRQNPRTYYIEANATP
jgi:hypothetical protein